MMRIDDTLQRHAGKARLSRNRRPRWFALAGAGAAAAAITLAGGGCEADAADRGAAAETTSSESDAPAEAGMLRYEVSGMSCTGCAQSIEQTISRLDGVAQCTVSFEDGVAQVAADRELNESIREAVEELGFGIAYQPDGEPGDQPGEPASGE